MYVLLKMFGRVIGRVGTVEQWYNWDVSWTGRRSGEGRMGKREGLKSWEGVREKIWDGDKGISCTGSIILWFKQQEWVHLYKNEMLLVYFLE